MFVYFWLQSFPIFISIKSRKHAYNLISWFTYFKHWIDYAIQKPSPTFLAPGTSFREDNFSMDGAGGGGWFRRWCERWEAPDEALLPQPPFTSCCVAWFLTGHRPIVVCGPGLGDPCHTRWGINFCITQDSSDCKWKKSQINLIWAIKREFTGSYKQEHQRH